MNGLAQIDFHGAMYEPERDLDRLTAQRRRVARAMMRLDWCDAEHVTRQIMRETGKREKVASVDRQMRYVRTWADATDGWRFEERDAGGGSKEYRLVRSER